MSAELAAGLMPAIGIWCVALISAWILARWIPVADNHYAALDGLRGFLAISIMIHHGGYWYSYARTGHWDGVPSLLHINLGRGSVILFFMVTAFLFFTKLLSGRKRPIDWPRLFVARICRLTPAYLFALTCMLAVIIAETGWRVVVPAETLGWSLLDWLLFVAPGAPDINAYANTHLILAGATWSLPYEWFFYFSLPLLAVMVGAINLNKSAHWVMASLFCVLSYSAWHLHDESMLAFLGGIAAAGVIYYKPSQLNFAGVGGSIAVLACLCMALTSSNIYALVPLILLATALTLVVGGADLFGLLRTRAARALGQLSYGIYLLHGLVLHLAMRTFARASLPVGSWHWVVVIELVPVVVAFAAIAFRLVELPGMRSTDRLLAWLRELPANTTSPVPSPVALPAPLAALAASAHIEP
jgi:peptidoglycan/LPS O-acetylase OafA/YrhL